MNPEDKGRLVAGAVVGAIVGAFISLAFYAMGYGAFSLVLIPMAALLGGVQSAMSKR